MTEPRCSVRGVLPEEYEIQWSAFLGTDVVLNGTNHDRDSKDAVFLQTPHYCPADLVIRRLGCRNCKVYACDISCRLFQLRVRVLSLSIMQLKDSGVVSRVVC
jgi:hypothetical protein